MTRKQVSGYTVVELLVSTAILGILAAILFPVLSSAKEAARTRHCLNNFYQIGVAMALYQGDYDDRVPPVNYKKADPNAPSDDRTWVQTLLPYAGEFALFRCPSDTGRHGAMTQAAVGPPAGDNWDRYYGASLRSNLGYNYLYFSPLIELAQGVWEAFPIQSSEIGDKSRTIAFIDSVWDRTQNGQPTGGGSWVVVPPCRYKLVGGAPYDTFEIPPGARSYFGFQPEGWQPAASLSWLVYGGAWPWHKNRFAVLFADGRVAALTVGDLTQGCAFRSGWSGTINDTDLYVWDLEP